MTNQVTKTFLQETVNNQLLEIARLGPDKIRENQEKLLNSARNREKAIYR